MKHLFLFGLLLSLPFFGFSQGEWNQWRFGFNAGLDFNTLPPVVVNGSAMGALEYPVSISDSLGNLLFYSNGATVWNRNNVIMQNGSGLYGGYVTQGVYSIKELASDSIYFLFTIRLWTDIFPHAPGLFYSKINMNLDGGLGGIIPGNKNIFVPGTDSVDYAMTGTRHKNNKDAWLVLRNQYPQAYYSYLISSSGFNPIPVTSPSCVIHQMNNLNPGTVTTKISQDGKRLVSVYHTYDDTVSEFVLLITCQEQLYPISSSIQNTGVISMHPSHVSSPKIQKSFI
ncbi:MAG: hypothetical protein NTU98_06380 [Bacteroidetes bacterium]|nr:hypothetical protein [Bacteroidota bacterium]